jgi:hypothetical protein
METVFRMTKRKRPGVSKGGARSLTFTKARSAAPGARQPRAPSFSARAEWRGR